MSESEPIRLRPRLSSMPGGTAAGHAYNCGITREKVTVFDRHELSQIFSVYGRKVAAGEWRDYALDMGLDKAVFSVFRRASEWPLYRIEKVPKLARRQGAYSIVAATGLIVKRGHDLQRVLGVLDKTVRAVD
ncbi:MAG: DUF2794 domain-containing protein [Hyphomicrobium sp.]